MGFGAESFPAPETFASRNKVEQVSVSAPLPSSHPSDSDGPVRLPAAGGFPCAPCPAARQRVSEVTFFAAITLLALLCAAFVASSQRRSKDEREQR